MGSGISANERSNTTLVRQENMSHRQTRPQTKEGELLKYGSFWSGWDTRFFKLERVYLHYYDTRHSPTPKSSVVRNVIVNVKPSVAFPDKEFVFEIHHKNGTIWYLQAHSMQEMVDWMAAISNTPLFVDPNQYPLAYPQPSVPRVDQYTHPQTIQASAPPAEEDDGRAITADSHLTHQHDLYPCLHGDFSGQQPMMYRNATPPPPYSEAVGERPSVHQ